MEFASSGAVISLQEYSHRMRLWPLIPALRANGVKNVLVVGKHYNPNNAEIAAEVAALGGRYIAPDWEAGKATALLRAVAKAFDLPMPPMLLPIPLCPRKVTLDINPQELALHMTVPDCQQAVALYRQQLSAATTVLDMMSARIFIVDQDDSLSDSPAWVRAVLLQKGTAVGPGIHAHIPFPSLKKIASTFPHRRIQSSLARFVYRNFPQWAAMYEGEPILRVPPWEALALEVLGLAPPSPWVIGSGFLQSLYMESRFIYTKTLRDNPCMHDSPALLCGSPVLDVLYNFNRQKAELRHAFCIRHNWNPALPTTLLILTGNAEQYFPTQDFTDFISMSQTIVREIATAGEGNVLVSLHPTAKPEEEEALAGLPCVVSREGVAQLLHLADRVVATGSSSLPWVLAVGLPVVDYQLYPVEDRYAVPQAEGLYKAESLIALRVILKVLAQHGKWEELAEKSRHHMEYWGVLDGQSTLRVMRDIEKQLAATSACKDNVHV